MATGFGIIISQGLNAYWTAGDGFNGDTSHTDIIERLGWQENRDVYLRHFVRVEIPRWEFGNFRYDEPNSLPGWAEGRDEEIKDTVHKILGKVNAIRHKYEKEIQALNTERSSKLVRVENEDDIHAQVLNDQVYRACELKLQAIKDKMIDEFTSVKGYLRPLGRGEDPIQ